LTINFNKTSVKYVILLLDKRIIKDEIEGENQH